MKINNLFKKVWALALLLVPMAAMADAVQYLVVTEKGGQETVFALAESPALTLESGNLKVACGTTTLEKSLDEILKYSFAETDANAIDEAVTDESGNSFEMRAGMVIFKGLAAGSNVSIMTVDGKLVAHITASADGRAVADLNGLGNGVFIMKTNNGSYKIKR